MTIQYSKPLIGVKQLPHGLGSRQETSLMAKFSYWTVFINGRFARHRSRRQLSKLSDHHLRDIGITREQAQNEMNQSFWK